MLLLANVVYESGRNGYGEMSKLWFKSSKKGTNNP